MKFEVKSAALPRAVTPEKIPVPQERTYTLNGKPERMAWVVLFGAFFVCLALTVSVPVFGLQFLRDSTLAQQAILQSAPLRTDQVTPVRVTLPNVARPIAIIEPSDIAENSSVETDTTDNSRAFMTFFETSTATIYKDARITLTEMRAPQFARSEQPNRIVIDQRRGLVRYGVASPVALNGAAKPRPTQFLVRTPHFDAWLDAGSYAINIDDTGSQMSVREGSATVVSKDGTNQVPVGQGQRVVYDVRAAAPDPFAVLPAAQELLVNGDFAGEIDCNPNASGPWKCYSEQGGDGGEVNGAIGVVTNDNRRAAWIRREGSNQNSAITGIRQIIDRDVSDYRTLKLSADVRIDSHNLSGGGYLSTEYPLILRVRYRDVNGDEAEYVRGFYVQNDTHNPTVNGELEPQGQWIPVESSNLLALPIKPFRILAIEVYASGWDYESYVSNVQLKAE